MCYRCKLYNTVSDVWFRSPAPLQGWISWTAVEKKRMNYDGWNKYWVFFILKKKMSPNSEGFSLLQNFGGRADNNCSVGWEIWVKMKIRLSYVIMLKKKMNERYYESGRRECFLRGEARKHHIMKISHCWHCCKTPAYDTAAVHSRLLSFTDGSTLI